MNATRKAVPSERGQIELATLKSAVAQALEKKRRLGQYAVIWQNGMPVMIGEDAPEVDRKHS
ncbi:MAG: hypothetical protein AB7F20_09130 [Geoalkalibacter sp.]|uniref:hypothetical protein n=1 Tax=Geoalkalibacter sp. TaxID=3041440 RepID=UPI003D0A7A76